MSFQIGTHTQYDDAQSILDPQIWKYAQEVKLPTFEGVIFNRLSAPEVPITQETYRIGSRTRTANTGTIGTGAGTGWVNGSATTSLPMAASQMPLLTIGSVIAVESETVVVKALDRTGNTIDVFQRGAGGSTAAAHADLTAFTIIGSAINDINAKDVEAMQEGTEVYENHPQLFFEVLQSTYTDVNEARKYFDMNPQIRNEALYRIFRRLAWSVVRGVKVDGTASIPPMSAGLLQQLSDTASPNANSRTVLRYNANGAFTENILKLAIDQGLTWGSPDTIYMSLKNAKILQPLTEKFIVMDPQQGQIAGTDNVRGYRYRNQIFEIVIDTAMPDDRVSIVTERLIHKAWKSQDLLRFVEEPPISSRVSRFSYQGKHTVSVRGVGFDHVDVYGIV